MLARDLQLTQTVDSVPLIWQNCLSVDSVPVIWQNSPYVEECASDLAELPFGRIVCLWVQCASASDLTELPVPVIWQNSPYVEECASDLAELPFGRIDCLWTQCASDLTE